VRGRPLRPLARDRVVRAAIGDVRLSELAASAQGPGFPDALGDLFAELQRSLAGPARFGAAVRAWREAGTAPPHAAELAALYSAYHRRLEALGAGPAERRSGSQKALPPPPAWPVGALPGRPPNGGR
jgi:hypothetical protein